LTKEEGAEFGTPKLSYTQIELRILLLYCRNYAEVNILEARQNDTLFSDELVGIHKVKPQTQLIRKKWLVTLVL